MKIRAKYDQLKVPSYALSYLVNGDSSGLEDEEITAIDKWLAHFTRIAALLANGNVIFSPNTENEDSYFTSSPAFGLACDVTDCTILIVN